MIRSSRRPRGARTACSVGQSRLGRGLGLEQLVDQPGLACGVGVAVGQGVAQLGVAGDDPLEAEQLVLDTVGPAADSAAPAGPPARLSRVSARSRSGPALPGDLGDEVGRRPPTLPPKSARPGPACPRPRGRVREGSAQGGAAVDDDGDREELLGEGAHRRPRVERGVEGRLHRDCAKPATSHASDVLTRGGTFSGGMSPASSSARKRSTMPLLARLVLQRLTDDATRRGRWTGCPPPCAAGRRPAGARPRLALGGLGDAGRLGLGLGAHLRDDRGALLTRGLPDPVGLGAGFGELRLVLLQSSLASAGPLRPAACHLRWPRYARRRSLPSAAPPWSCTTSTGCRRRSGRRSSRRGAGAAGSP